MNKEIFRDFMGTLNVQIERGQKTLSDYESYMDTHDYDASDVYEWREQKKVIEHFRSIRKYFEQNGMPQFNTLQDLENYNSELMRTYEQMSKMSEIFCTRDGELVGISQKMWEKYESVRYQVSNAMDAYYSYYTFCSTGELEEIVWA